MVEERTVTLTKEAIASQFQTLQDQICLGLELLDGKAKFVEDKWERQGGGGGRTRVIQDGDLISKGGVNFSAVYGETPDVILRALGLPKSDFFATGISIVLHSQNPWVPIIHMNIRLFEMSDGTWWFGGGIDATPHYVIPSQAGEFHRKLKNVCDQFSDEFYANFKRWADDYFFIKHRKETRGVGGIFFDRLDTASTGMSKEGLFEFVYAVGSSFLDAYTGLASPNRNKPFDQNHLDWQWIRRGRYAEFNLVYDKGTKFGLDTEGRIESILMSLPPQASWVYSHNPALGSLESDTLQWLKKGIDWTAQ